MEEWLDKLPTVCSGYSPENIFNMDETGLFYIKESTNGSRHYPNYKIEILQETVVST